jgi:hypothetical protein
VKSALITFSLLGHHNRSSSRLKLPTCPLILALVLFPLTSSKPKKLVLTSLSSRQFIYLSSEIIGGKRYLGGGVIADVLVAAAHFVLTKCPGVETSRGVGEEAESIELVLDPPLELLITRGRTSRVVVEVAKVGKEGTILDLGLMEVLLLERLLVKPPLGHVLAEGVLPLGLVLT